MILEKRNVKQTRRKVEVGGGGAQVDLFLGDQCSYVFEALF